MKLTNAFTGMLPVVFATSMVCLPGSSAAQVQGGSAVDAVDNKLFLELISDAVNVPWGIAELPSGELLVTERRGELIRLEPSGVATRIKGLPEIWSKGQGGLLDVAIHPDYPRQPWVYFSYSKPTGGGSQTALARAKIVSDQLTEWTDLYIGKNASGKKQHFGSRIVLQGGYVFFGIGDRGERKSIPQDLSKDGGKVYRLHDDGEVPIDNPFVGTDGALPAVWSYGHRNPQGMVYDLKAEKLWAHEHGPRGGDELNLIEPGKNYGWPLATFGINYWGTKITDDTELTGMQSPNWHWTPSIAPSGMAVVDGRLYPSLGDGLLIGSLKFGELHFHSTVAEEPNMQVVLKGLDRVRSLAAGGDGTVYVGISGRGVFRLRQE